MEIGMGMGMEMGIANMTEIGINMVLVMVSAIMT